jgi:hypothetical protein
MPWWGAEAVAGLIEAIAWIGGAATLVAYALVSSGGLRGRSALFQALNLAGAAALAWSAVRHGAWPSAAVNAAWIAIGLATLPRGVARERDTRTCTRTRTRTRSREERYRPLVSQRRAQ